MTNLFAGFSSIPTRFDESKTAAAAAILLREAGGSMEYMRLLKYLYLADRMSWEKLGRPITGDDYVSMDQGPVLSNTYNLIKAEGELEDETGPWQQAVERISRYNVSLRGDPDVGPLSEAEIEMLKEVHRRYRKMTIWALVKHLHKTLPEWTNPKGSSITILPETILKAVGRSPQQIEQVSNEARERVHFQRLLGAR